MDILVDIVNGVVILFSGLLVGIFIARIYARTHLKELIFPVTSGVFVAGKRKTSVGEMWTEVQLPLKKAKQTGIRVWELPDSDAVVVERLPNGNYRHYLFKKGRFRSSGELQKIPENSSEYEDFLELRGLPLTRYPNKTFLDERFKSKKPKALHMP